MAFCTFSKDVDSAYTVIDNKFITKYLPEADGFAVQVYLYGLLLCQNTDSEFSVRAMAEVLKTTEEKILEAYAFWEDYDLVEILSRDPFTVHYLPVRSTTGRPKKTNYGRYADFNKELQRKMQKVGKFISPPDYIKYMRFLEENEMQPQAFLLVAEYCINKKGKAVSPSYLFNKAEKLIDNGCFTYNQVESALSNYNEHEGDLLAVYAALGLSGRTPDESDYALYGKWTEKLGFSRDSVLLTAKKQKLRSITSLELALDELYAKGKTEVKEIENYLNEREFLFKLTCKLRDKLGAKVEKTTTYIDAFTEKWYEYGFEESSLVAIALYCFKTDRKRFENMHELVLSLFKNGIVSADSVKAFLKNKNDELELFTKIQAVCGGLRKSAANLELVSTWQSWGFDESMILEAAKRSASGSNPIPYMNKILSDWKQKSVFAPSAIPAPPTSTAQNGNSAPRTFINPSVDAANAKAERERYYALLREKAQSVADKFLAKANTNARFKEIVSELPKMELAFAKAEMYDPAKLPALKAQKKALLLERKQILASLGIEEAQLVPQFTCPHCSDTGFLPNGTACNCYKAEK